MTLWYIDMGSSRWESWMYPICPNVEISKYEEYVEYYAMSIISSSLGYMKSACEWKWY